MSQEDVERLRAGCEEFARSGTFTFDWYAPEFAFWQRPGEESAGGLDEFQRAAADFMDIFDDFYYRPEEFSDMGDQIVVIGRMGGRAKGSGALIDQRIVHEWKVRDGLAIQLCAYADTAEGREWRREHGPS